MGCLYDGQSGLPPVKEAVSISLRGLALPWKRQCSRPNQRPFFLKTSRSTCSRQHRTEPQGKESKGEFTYSRGLHALLPTSNIRLGVADDSGSRHSSANCCSSSSQSALTRSGSSHWSFWHAQRSGTSPDICEVAAWQPNTFLKPGSPQEQI